MLAKRRSKTSGRWPGRLALGMELTPGEQDTVEAVAAIDPQAWAAFRLEAAGAAGPTDIDMITAYAEAHLRAGVIAWPELLPRYCQEDGGARREPRRPGGVAAQYRWRAVVAVLRTTG